METAALKAGAVRSYLSCAICDEAYKKPKYLSCYHSYCEECLVKLEQSQQGESQRGESQWATNLICPQCKKTSPIPTGGVQQLPSNFFIDRLLDEIRLNRTIEGREEVKCGLCVRENSVVEVLCQDCGAFLCSCCYDNHKYSRKECHNHNVVPIKELHSRSKDFTIKPKVVSCSKHDLELKFYCETCYQLTCEYCVMKDHMDHDHDTTKRMATKHRKELDEIVRPVEKMIEELSAAQIEINDTKDIIRAQADDIGNKIDRYYEELTQRLCQQRDELKKELHEVYRQKENEITPHLSQVEHIQTQLENIKKLKGAVMDGSDQETLLMKKGLADDVKRLSEHYGKLDMQPAQFTTMEFVPIEEYKKSLPQFARLFDGPCSDTSEVLNIPQWAFEGDNIKFKIITRDRNKHLCCRGGNTIIVCSRFNKGAITPVEIKDNEDGSCSASFVANQVGEVKLSVTIKGEQIKGSPFNIKVRGKYNTIDKPIKAINNKVGKAITPWGIAFGKNCMWAVTDRYNHCVQIFDRQGKMIQTFGGNGSEKGKFNGPSGIAFDCNNHLYVTDSWNNRVQKFTVTGTHLLQFGNRRSGNGQLNNPLGILVNNRQVYVAENSGKRISVFQLDGQFSHIIGSGYLKSPCYVAVNADQLLVADCGHHCISMFTLDGNYVGKFGTKGTSSGQLKNPFGIATDTYGFILVTEENNNRVSIFDKDGEHLHCFGSKGSGHGQFSLPRGIVISPIGDIYICDSSNERIQVF